MYLLLLVQYVRHHIHPPVPVEVNSELPANTYKEHYVARSAQCVTKNLAAGISENIH